MNNPHMLLAFAYHIIGAPSREHAAYVFTQMCRQDIAAAAHLAEFLAYVMPDSVDLWGGVLHEVSEHLAMRQEIPPPFLWNDTDSEDTAESIDAHLHEGGDHGSAIQ